MISFLVTLALIAAVIAAGFGLERLVVFIRRDCYATRDARNTPRSHPTDPFDPRSRLA